MCPEWRTPAAASASLFTGAVTIAAIDAVLREPHAALDVLVGGAPADGAHAADLEAPPGRRSRGRAPRSGPARTWPRSTVAIGAHRLGHVGDPGRRGHHARVADDERARLLPHVRLGQCLGRDLGPDPGGVSHRDPEHRADHAQAFHTRTSASASPKPPAFVSTARPSNGPPASVPSARPGSSWPRQPEATEPRGPAGRRWPSRRRSEDHGARAARARSARAPTRRGARPSRLGEPASPARPSPAAPGRRGRRAGRAARPGPGSTGCALPATTSRGRRGAARGGRSPRRSHAGRAPSRDLRSRRAAPARPSRGLRQHREIRRPSPRPRRARGHRSCRSARAARPPRPALDAASRGEGRRPAARRPAARSASTLAPVRGSRRVARDRRLVDGPAVDQEPAVDDRAALRGEGGREERRGHARALEHPVDLGRDLPAERGVDLLVEHGGDRGREGGARPRSARSRATSVHAPASRCR